MEGDSGGTAWHPAAEDGYLNEGRAADRLEARASATREDRDARIQARIAAEERGHALLGRDVARWCLAA